MKKKIMGLFLLIVICVCAGSAVVVTQPDEYKLIRQFGKIERVLDEPGISFKVPFVETADTLPKMLLLYDIEPSDIISKDKKTMILDSYIIWQIADPVKFAQSLNSSIGNAENRINTAVYNSTKNVVSSMNQDDIITARDGTLSADIMENIGTTMEQYGIELKAVETKRLDLPGDNKEAVYERMISERDNIAATYIAEGQSQAQVIRNTTDKEIAISISEAEKNAEILIAEGEAEYMKILSAAYDSKDKTEFYSFVRSLDALKASMKGDNKTVVLSADSPIARIFNGYEE